MRRPAATARGAARLALAGSAALLIVAGCAAPPPAPEPPPAPRATQIDTTVAPPPPVARAGPPPLDLGTAAPALGPPRAAAARVSWAPSASPAAERLRAEFRSVGVTGDPDSIWVALAVTDARLEPIALRRSAALHARRGDSLAADQALARLAALSTPWQWEALRGRVDLAVARGEVARADSLLETAARESWPDLERAAWLLRRARLRAQLGDGARAVQLARQLIRRYPSTSPAVQGVTLLETLLAGREEKLSAADQEAAAEVAVFAGELERAAARLRAALRLEPDSSSKRRVRLAEILRQDKSFEAAAKVLREAGAGTQSSLERGRLALEEARVHRDAGRVEPSLSRYAEAARLLAADAESVPATTATPRNPTTALLETAFWEAAMEADQAGSTARARELYLEVARLGGRRAADARLRIGLLWLVEGAHQQAAAAWSTASSVPERFWRGVALRALQPQASDSLLRSVAALPGFGFYETAARETLGIAGWPRSVAADSCPDTPDCAALELARDLIVLAETPGFVDAARARSDAALLISRWAAGDARVTDEEPRERDPRTLLAAARLAYALERMPAAIRFARNAAEAAAEHTTAEQWAIAPWLYPPAFDALYATLPETAEPGAPDRALVQAVTWQESKFDPDARSRSNALGLMQLKRAAASDAAGWLREPPPTEARMRDPATNFRYGVIYLKRLLTRFGGRTSVALAAYNAGPGRVPAQWRTWIERGGDALVAELVPYPETRDYVKRILGVRHAYRELAPSRSIP